MIEKLKELLGLSPAPDFSQLRKEGALILDVRTKAEFAGGHIKGSVNIPLQDLSRQLKRLPEKEKPIVTCCATGMRSSSAKSLLLSKGYQKVYNGGGWRNLSAKL